MKLKIGLDLDGVIIDHALNKIKLAKQYGYFLKPAEASSEVMKKIVPIEVKRFIQKGIYGKEGLTSKPIKSAKEILKEITKLFSVPYLISRRSQDEEGRKFALQWLKNNNFLTFLNQKRILFVDADIGKNPLCEKLNINVYLDDKIKVLNNLFSVKYKVLFDPYGHYHKSPPLGIKVIKTWQEFYKYLQKISDYDTLN